MAKAIFTGKKVKELSRKNVSVIFRMFDTPFVRFSKNLFMCYRPADARNWNREYKKPDNLSS
ncbi:hypothetical protein D3C80_2052990 [compost metagenome]